ncbi:unnamed protein product [Camellia sinensis]
MSQKSILQPRLILYPSTGPGIVNDFQVRYTSDEESHGDTLGLNSFFALPLLKLILVLLFLSTLPILP